MIGQKILKTLQTLDSATFRRLGDAFASPYFTSSPLLLKLYALLKKEYPAFDAARLNKEKIYDALYPGKPFNDGALRVLVREFSKITEDFLVFESLKNDEAARQKALTQWYGAHNLYAEFEKSTLALLAKMEQQPYRDVEYFNDAADLLASYFFHQHTEKYTLDDQVLTQLMESADRSYILLKLRLASEMKNRERILSKQYEMPLLNEALAIGEAGLLQDNVPFALYRLLLTMYETGENPEAFQSLKDLLFQQIGVLRPFDQSMLLTQLTNYAVRQLNKGNSGFNQEVFELYQLALVHKLVLSNGKIEAALYQNIVSTGCKEKAFAWTEQFVEEYAPFLEADIRQDCKTMALALVCFNRSNYDQAIQMINEHRFFNVLIQMSARVILAKAWFEKFLQDIECYGLLVSQLESNEKSIRRNRVVSAHKKEENLNFFIAVKLVASLFAEKQPASLIRSRLGKNMGADQRMVSRGWLQLKIDQYEAKQSGA
ncbi:MAG: hypothetical protein Q7U74_00765 [Saprospiraceae bacterium]|nr:hypothetical protein [Saprospiraceae bacterium]